ncbi:alpha/beta hydrolase [Corynebacterium caspium]|uniref:alpha/beta hydrolase n=1 Tax=Corynebacterium caspium TaxID=234828 RepID=UPI000368C63E|nr:alpha/beta hydrolase-fold protein [Corynebacterium caspium]WKD58486.1 Putative esterase [Corynebacterium caspium DSM 44850]
MFHPSLLALAGPKAIVLVTVLLVFALLVALWAALRPPSQDSGPNKWRLLALPIAGIVLIAWGLLSLWWKPFGEAVAWFVYASTAVLFYVCCALALAKGSRKLLIPAVLAAILGFVGSYNIEFQIYPTVRSLSPVPAAAKMNLEEFQAQTKTPIIHGRAVGAQVNLEIPGVISGFKAREAMAYIPPSYWTQPNKLLPVIILMHGNPGEPGVWFNNGEVGEIADIYQIANNGVAPIIISVDATGSYAGNPICIDGPELKIHTYLTQDVPTQVRQIFRVQPDTKYWTIGGLSYGGTCALQVITNAPEVYGSFLDFSGQPEPSVGNHEDTVREFFNNDEKAFNAVDPAHLLNQAAELGSDRYHHIGGIFISGTNDNEAKVALQRLNELAQAAGMDTTYGEVPGGHDYKTWRQAFAQSLPWAAVRGGL